MLALDVARIEAGLILIDVDYISSKKALIESQKYSPSEVGLGRLVHYDKENFIGRAGAAGRKAARPGERRWLVSRSIGTMSSDSSSGKGLAPQTPATASRIHVPVYKGREQVGKATSTTWSPLLKQLIALASVRVAVRASGNEAGDGDDGRGRSPQMRRYGAGRCRSSIRREKRKLRCNVKARPCGRSFHLRIHHLVENNAVLDRAVPQDTLALKAGLLEHAH